MAELLNNNSVAGAGMAVRGGEVYNELVLVSFGDSHYLYDGYPSLSSLGSGAEVNEALRRENFERHRAGWELFVSYLREEGRLSE